MNYETQTMKENKDSTPTIIMRKNTIQNSDKMNTNRSLVIIETQDKKVSFNIINEQEFLNKNNINSNLNIVRSSLIGNMGMNLNLNTPNNFSNNPNIKNKSSLNNSNMLDDMKINQSIDNIHIETVNKRVDNKLNIPIPKYNSNKKSSEIKKTVENNIEKVTLEKNNLDETIEIKNNIDPNFIKSETNTIPSPISPSIKTIQYNYNPSNNYNSSANLNHINSDLVNPKNSRKATDTVTGTLKMSNSKRSPRHLHTKSPIILVGKNNEHFVIKPININEEDINYEQGDETTSEPFPFRICFICDQFYLKEKSFTAEECDHTFCHKCGKAYYEEKIEQGDLHFKCPVFKCMKHVKIDTIRFLVSEKHFAASKDDIDSNFPNNPDNVNTNSIKNKIIRHKQSMNNFINVDSIKLYSQKHVLDINTNESFFIFNKAKEQFCIKCSEPALYGKNGKYIVKCLNCYHVICKFCMKPFSNDHFDITAFNYCKVYFRRRLRKISLTQEKSACKSLMFMLLFLFVSYFMIVFGAFKLISVLFQRMLCLGKKSRKCLVFKNLIYYFLLIIFCMITFCLSILIIPFLPSFLSLT
jgi:hypothetical protein